MEVLHKLKGNEYNFAFKPAVEAKPTSKIFRAAATATELVVTAVSSAFTAFTFHLDLPIRPMLQAPSSAGETESTLSWNVVEQVITAEVRWANLKDTLTRQACAFT
jgi:hypothetical protein